MKERLGRWLPSPETLQRNRWLRWMGPVIHHPRLWHLSRKGVALGLALGIFFGLLIPFAQIPASAALAVALRANLPVAVASTMVTNPVTFGPVYYAAYRLGKALLGEPPAPDDVAMQQLQAVHQEPEAAQSRSLGERLSLWWRRFGNVGKPLALGLALMATVGGLAAFFITNGLWVLRTRWVRRKRLRARSEPPRNTRPPTQDPS